MNSNDPNFDPAAEGDLPVDAYASTDPLAVPEGPTQGQIDAMKAELDKAKDQTLRAMAEAENTRKRAAREREDATKYAVTNFSRDMLNVADNLRRALDAIPAELKTDAGVAALIEGIEATQRDLEKTFTRYGIRKIDPMGELFNPNYHEVMFEASVPGQPAGNIIQVIDVGYLLHDRLIRPARVGVAKDEGQGNANRGPSGEPGGHIDTQA